MVKGGIKMIKKKEIISIIDTLILACKQDEIDYPFAPNRTLQAYWNGKKDALTELKNILEELK